MVLVAWLWPVRLLASEAGRYRRARASSATSLPFSAARKQASGRATFQTQYQPALIEAERHQQNGRLRCATMSVGVERSVAGSARRYPDRIAEKRECPDADELDGNDMVHDTPFAMCERDP